MAVFSGGCASPVENVVPDPGFQACLNSYLGHKAKAAISADMLRGLNPPDGVFCTSSTTPFGMLYTWGVGSLEGAQYLTAVTTLRFPYSGIDDLSPLAGLASLRTLDVSRNAITDLSPLDGLDLASLDATAQYLGDVRGPAGKPITLPVVIGRDGKLVTLDVHMVNPAQEFVFANGQVTVSAPALGSADWRTADGSFSGNVGINVT